MKCKVKLLSGFDGATFVIDGEVTELADGIEVKYTLDGDECVLRFSGKAALYTRRGGVGLYMRLVAGERTECTVGAEGFTGDVPVYCEKACLKETDGGYEINLSYIFCGEKTDMKVTVIY